MDTSKINVANLSRRISSAKSRILSSFPFYGVLIMDTKFYLDEKEQTFSTDGKAIYFNPVYLESLNDYELDISILHEIFHILLKHPFRYEKTMNNDLYHLAADIVVNSNIMKSNNVKTPLYVKGKMLEYLAPNGKEGYLFTTEEVYKMVCKKFSHLLTKSRSSDHGEKGEEADNEGEQKSDTFEKQIGPKMINPLFTFNPNKNGVYYFRNVSLKDYTGNFCWTINEDYKIPNLKNNPLLFTSDKLKGIAHLSEGTLKSISKEQRFLPVVGYPSRLTPTFYDVESIVNRTSSTQHYYHVNFGLDLLNELTDKTFSNVDIRNDEITYSDIVYHRYLAISPEHKEYFLKFAKQRNIQGDIKSLIISARNAIATCAKYDLGRYPIPKGKDDVIYFMDELKKGKCLHFATALTLLYRALGIPARFVGGYMFRCYKNMENTIYKESAHAWTEVYLKGTGWITVDATPVSADNSQSSGDDGFPSPFDSNSKWGTHKLDESDFNNKVLNAYDAQQRSDKNCGKMPGFIELFVKSLRKPKIDWRQALNEFVQEDNVDYSYNQPDTRYSECDFILPSFCEKDDSVRNILFMIDCSGSMSDTQIMECFSEIRGAIDQFNGKLSGDVGFFDDIVHKVYHFEEVNDLLKCKPQGRGGTDFYRIFEYIDENRKDDLPTSIVILTDGIAPIPPKSMSKDIPVLWIINNSDAEPDWGRVIHIE